MKGQEMKNAQDEADFESQSVLQDTGGQHLASVTVRFSPKSHYGSFRLPPSADVDQILAKVASLQTSDDRHLRVSNLRRCPAVHLVEPHRPHLEFDYEPLG
jgi:hypothetical protein